MAKSRSTYSIRQVIELTGVSEFLLRGWENRYGALKPKRTASGRRLYNSDDVLRARALLELTNRGHRVGKIAHLGLKDLDLLLGTPTEPEQTPTPAPPAQSGRVKIVLIAARNHAWDQVKAQFAREVGSRSLKAFIHDFASPLINEINHLVTAGEFSIAQEHIVTAYIRESLAGWRVKARRRAKPWRVVLAAPEGDYHDIGLLIACKLAAAAGAEALHLGPHMPKRDLAETCLRFKASHLILSSTVSRSAGAKDDLAEYVNYLDRHVPKGVTLWLAGRNAQNHKFSIKRKFKIIKSLADFEEELKHEP